MNKAYQIISSHKDKLDEISAYLLEKETITGEEFMEILERKPEETAEENLEA